ncbi:hypothetical protein HPP92_011824 [Vanilla planifolia]|uniref:Uncharacterized protein n=1 Tax=Vanilla planifolia TaxID=51239 RepID=A0A835R1I1_VANPL|nr:hypothetical protein HPP92_011824 [Vanilla planifolia]
MREPKGTVGAVKAMKHDSSPTRAMRDPKGTAGAGEEMKQRREMLKVGYQQSPHFAMDDDSRSIDHWRKFFDNTGLDIFELIENAVYVARMDYPKEFISKQQTKNFFDPSQDHVNPSMLDEEVDRKQTIPQGIVNKLGKPFTTHSRPGKNLSLLSIPKQENQTCEIQTKPSVVEDNKTKQPKKEINQASLERAKRKLKEGYQQAEIDEYFFDGVEATMFVVDQLSLVSKGSEYFTSDVLHFLHLKRKINVEAVGIPDRPNEFSFVLKARARALSFNFSCLNMKEASTIETIATLYLRLDCSSAVRNGLLKSLDAKVSSFLRHSFCNDVLLASFTSHIGATFRISINFCRSFQGNAEIVFAIPAIDIWLHMHEWVSINAFLCSLKRKLDILFLSTVVN